MEILLFLGQNMTTLNNIEIKELALSVGFDLCGITRCAPLSDDKWHFEQWLAAGYHCSLGYMERHQEKRFDASKLVEGAKSVVVCAVGYKNDSSMGYPQQFNAKVASYARCVDYHTTIKEMLNAMLVELKKRYPSLSGRTFVDTAPLAEKRYAVEAGLGWIGRQSLLITPKFGSYLLLGELVISDEVDAYDKPFEGSRCGRCNNCVESCPTGAIVAPKIIDTTHCIACHTVEQAPDVDIDLNGWIFGCDECQSCCPYNRTAPEFREERFTPIFNPLEYSVECWSEMNEEEFSERFSRTPMQRGGLANILESIKKG